VGQRLQLIFQTLDLPRQIINDINGQKACHADDKIEELLIVHDGPVEVASLY
jgi:hypothetical protein